MKKFPKKSRKAKSLIPSSIQGEVFDSLESFGKAIGLNMPEVKQRKKECFKCGSPMRRIRGTNIYLCTGEGCNSRAIVRHPVD